MMKNVASRRRAWVAGAATLGLSILLQPTLAAAESAPAVSEINGKISLQAGHAEVAGNKGDGFVHFGEVAFTFPLGRMFGAQVEGALGTTNGLFFGSTAGQFFWRDPSRALLGVTAQYATLSGAHLGRFGVTGEYYWRELTFTAHVGGQIGSDNKAATIRVGDGAFGRADVRWYPFENLMLLVGGGFEPLFKSNTYQGKFHFGAEYQFADSVPGLTLVLNGDIGTRNHHAVTAGVRYYFGFGPKQNKTLINRHRYDDPPTMTNASFQSFQKGTPPAPPTSQPCTPIPQGLVAVVDPCQQQPE